MNSKKPVIIVRDSMVAYGNGWAWDIKIIEKDLPGTGTITRYCTNENGNGLWRCGSHIGNQAADYNDHQIEGTAQFFLPLDYGQARHIVKRYFEKMYCYKE